MSTKKRKKSDEDDQDYFAEEDNKKNDDRISYAKVGYSRLARLRASHHSVFMVNCLTISHTCLLCLPGRYKVIVFYISLIGLIRLWFC